MGPSIFPRGQGSTDGTCPEYGTFKHLSQELVTVEDHLAAARKYYNGSVRIYNTFVQSLPQHLLARPFGFRPAEYFQLEEGRESED